MFRRWLSCTQQIVRSQYKPPPFVTKHVDLDLHLDPKQTIVRSEMYLSQISEIVDDLELDGDPSIKLSSVLLNDSHFNDYEITETGLKISSKYLDPEVKLTTIVEINPRENKQLSGLYMSSDAFVTQCEAHGFRRITYFQDRPDVMASYRVRLHSPETLNCPVLLSNGNLELFEQYEDGNNMVTWFDPYPKPSYLFAIVAGDLDHIEDTFTTKSGKNVILKLYSDKKNTEELQYAMKSLKDAMKWDEERFDLEYDLDIYHIVAVRDFNMGAMENKSLNIFNTSCLLAHPSTSTDQDFQTVQSVVAHEYFHNYTGNRVTCRDWFQLTLKEGLTVFRDQEFSADMHSAAVKRIEDVKRLRSVQFREDASPLSHPIRFESYNSVENFYTSTVYLKGAEVVRMYQTILGKEKFANGLQIYLNRHDGTAATCDDFRDAMAEAGNIRLDQFSRWYSQNGTPTVTVTSDYDESSKKLRLIMEQDMEPPLLIPIRIGIMGSDGEAVGDQLLQLTEKKQAFEFDDVPEYFVPSLLRNFSAPVILNYDYSDEDLALLMEKDTDSFNRWEAGQFLGARAIFDELDQKEGGALSQLISSFASLLDEAAAADDDADLSLIAYALILPDEKYLYSQREVIQPFELFYARRSVKRAIYAQLREKIHYLYEQLETDDPGTPENHFISRRLLRNVCLEYICSTDEISNIKLCYKQFEEARCMTDRVAAIRLLASSGHDDLRRKSLDEFYKIAETNELVLDKWFAVQALNTSSNVLEDILKLRSHPRFTIENPNRLRALVMTFAMNNPRFHDGNGTAYEFLRNTIEEVDSLNPITAARLATCFSEMRRYDENQSQFMHKTLEKLAASNPSKDLGEIVTKILGK